MGTTVSRDNGQAVVKIKRAGGYVQEIYRPISAQEVMLHNPKHWVTKVGVFRSQNPVAEVVPPESVLMPGETFFLVPFQTMQTLLKRHCLCPAALDHLMDRPGLAITEWYHQQQQKTSAACPQNRNCSCDKKNSPVCMVAITLSKQPSLKQQGQQKANSELDSTSLKCWKLVKEPNEAILGYVEAAKSGGLIYQDDMQHVTDKSIEGKMVPSVNSKIKCFEAKLVSPVSIEQGIKIAHKEFSAKQAMEGLVAPNKTQCLTGQQVPSQLQELKKVSRSANTSPALDNPRKLGKTGFGQLIQGPCMCCSALSPQRFRCEKACTQLNPPYIL